VEKKKSLFSNCRIVPVGLEITQVPAVSRVLVLKSILGDG
jgi:hypothetical protein